MTIESLDADIRKLQDEISALLREADAKHRALADLMRQRNALLVRPPLSTPETA